MRRLLSKLFQFINLSIIKRDKLNSIDRERQLYRHEVDRLNFIFLNDRVKNPYELYEYANKSESQIFQDLFVLNELEFKKNGFFVEIGAADGVRFSNTYLLEKYFSWSGLVVEPAKIWSDKLEINRNCQISYDCVYSHSNLMIEFSEAQQPEFSRATFKNDILPDEHEENRKIGAKTYELKTLSINDLFLKYNIQENFDYLSIDTEGAEFLILNSLDFEKYKISIISVEHNNTENREKIYSLLTRNNYERVLEKYSKFDDWYIKKNT